MKLLTLSVRLFSIALFACSSLTVVQAASNPDSPKVDQQLFLPMISRGRPLVNEVVASFEPAASGSADSFYTPMDATPDADGNTFYFTAMSDQGAGVFRVPATGGTVVTLTLGAPLTMPFGLAINESGQTIYIADTSATSPDAQAASGSVVTACSGKQGGIFSLPAGGGTPVLVPGTACTAPRGITVMTENDADMIYFTGVDPSDNQPAVMKIPASGGSLTLLDKGSPLVDPVGITVASDTRVYVTDQGTDTVYRIKQGVHSTRSSHREAIAKDIRMGSPAGVTLTLDQSNVLVSSLDESTGTSQVVVINTTTLDQAVVNAVISANHASGGLHRAQNSKVMAWCGVTAGTGGQGIVFRVELK